MKSKSSPINMIWFSMIVLSIVTAAHLGNMEALNKALFDSAKGAVTLALGLIGPMALWLGIMKVAEVGGLMKAVAHALRPVMVKLFPDVPAEHPAMAAIIMNMAANMLGLGNAATPMGIKAMQELEKLSPKKGVATDSMALFLAINTSSVTLLPLGVITIRAASENDIIKNPASILLPALIATICSTTVAIIASKLMAKANPLQIETDHKAMAIEEKEEILEEEKEEKKLTRPGFIKRGMAIIMLSGFFAVMIGKIATSDPIWALFQGDTSLLSLQEVMGPVTTWLIPIILLTLLSYGFFKGVELYETVTEGAKEGFQTAVRIIPFMVAIFVAIGLVRASGLLDLLNTGLQDYLFVWLKIPKGFFPTEALSMALIRPLSGSGAFGIMSEIVNTSKNLLLVDMVSVMQGSTETTFYVLAVYFGAVGVTKTRHALPAALCADVAGILAAIIATHLLLGGGAHQNNTVDEFALALQEQKVILLDVRTAAEYQSGHIAGSTLTPLHELKKDLGKFKVFDKANKEKPIYVYCRSGKRSNRASKLLVKKGFTNVHNLRGGILAWKRNKKEVVTPKKEN